MTPELFWMTLTVLMTALFWATYIPNRLQVQGIWPALAGTGTGHSPWAERAMAAHRNAVENLVIFVPAVLAAHALGVSTATTGTAAAVYFFARLVHFVVHTAGIPVVRTLAFAVGWLAQIAILASVLGWL